MRIRYDEQSVYMISYFYFCQAGEVYEDGQEIRQLFIYVDHEPIGQVKLDAFESYDAALKWSAGVTQQLVVNGYWDLYKDLNKVALY